MVGSPTLTSCMSILLKFLIAWTQHLPQVYFASCMIASILLTSAYYLFFLQIFFQESEDILLMDLSSEIDSNQNCVKGNPFTSSSVPRAPSSLSLENPFSSQCNFFPTPIHDPFSDDPFSKSDDQSIRDDSATASHSHNNLFNGGPKNGDTDYLGQQFDQLSNRTIIHALSNGHWPLDGRAAEATSWTQKTVPVQEQNGHGKEMPNPFMGGSEKMQPVQNGVKHENGGIEPPVNQTKDSVIISPPPLNMKAGRGRRSVKVRLHWWHCIVSYFSIW